MPDTEVPLQRDMFTDELVDTRDSKQKRKARQRQLPQQQEMFSQRELAQFGVRANPKLPISPKTRLELAMEDRRTEEEKEQDRMRQAQAQTYPLFARPQEAEASEQPPEADREPLSPPETISFPSGIKLPVVKPEEPGGEVIIPLFGDVDIHLWSSRDEAYERALDNHWILGYRAYQVGDNQLEIWLRDRSGGVLITYSDMQMVENIEWMDTARFG
jgi:hypothetical protein